MPIHIAVANADLSMLDYLLNNKADPNVNDNWKLRNTSNIQNQLELRIRLFPYLNTNSAFYGFTPLHYAVCAHNRVLIEVRNAISNFLTCYDQINDDL